MVTLNPFRLAQEAVRTASAVKTAVDGIVEGGKRAAWNAVVPAEIALHQGESIPLFQVKNEGERLGALAEQIDSGWSKGQSGVLSLDELDAHMEYLNAAGARIRNEIDELVKRAPGSALHNGYVAVLATIDQDRADNHTIRRLILGGQRKVLGPIVESVIRSGSGMANRVTRELMADGREAVLQGATAIVGSTQLTVNVGGKKP